MEEQVATWEMYEMVQAFLQAPLYHLALEGLLMMWVLWLLFRKSYNPQEETVLTEKEKDELIAEWQPEPLVPEVDSSHPALNPRTVSGRIGKEVTVDGKHCINLATHNYLGMIENPKVEEAAIKSLRKYGVGSCGPRGFYGTIDVHLDLENKLSSFMGVEETVLYSYGFATIASAIPAYAKKGDVIFADEGVNFAIQKGLQASRSDIRYFRHNDVEHLESLLKTQEANDIKNPKKAKVTRRFLIIEGIYTNYCDICPLPKLIELKNRYRVRLFIDENLSFAVLGKTGRGITEHYGISIDEADLVCASLEYAIGSNGGFACGTSFVVDHQRLSGLGYCFSASLPPMLASAATAAIIHLEENPDLLTTLRNNAVRMHEELRKITEIRVGGDPISPVKQVYLSDPCEIREVAVKKLEAIADNCVNNGVAVVVARYLDKQEHLLPSPSIRITVSATLSNDEIRRVVDVFSKACDACL
ncbi:Serine palmitoyltransferase 1 [Chamberlinius hualienensis]